MKMQERSLQKIRSGEVKEEVVRLSINESSSQPKWLIRGPSVEFQLHHLFQIGGQALLLNEEGYVPTCLLMCFHPHREE